MLQRRRSRGRLRRHAEVRKNRWVGGCLPKSCELLGLLAIAKACTWFPQVLADLQSGDERDRGRNESLILGSLSEELQAQAYFHIYGSLLQTSALLCELGRAASKEFPVSCSTPNPLSQTTSSHTHHPPPSLSMPHVCGVRRRVAVEAKRRSHHHFKQPSLPPLADTQLAMGKSLRSPQPHLPCKQLLWWRTVRSMCTCSR